MAQTIGILVVSSVLTFVFMVVFAVAAAWYVNFGPGQEAHRKRVEAERAERRERERISRGESSWRLPEFRVDRVVPAHKLKPETRDNGSSDLAAS